MQGSSRRTSRRSHSCFASPWARRRTTTTNGTSATKMRTRKSTSSSNPPSPPRPRSTSARSCPPLCASVTSSASEPARPRGPRPPAHVRPVRHVLHPHGPARRGDGLEVARRGARVPEAHVGAGSDGHGRRDLWCVCFGVLFAWTRGVLMRLSSL
jgi:hypothetical protein